MTVFSVGFVLVSLYFPSYILFCITVHRIYFVCVCVCVCYGPCCLIQINDDDDDDNSK